MEEFSGSITGFQTRVFLEKGDLIFSFIEEEDGERIFQRRIKKHGQRKGRQIKQLFTSYIKLLKYIREYEQDHHRISIDASGTMKIVYFTNKRKPKDAPTIYIEGFVVKNKQELENIKKVEENLAEMQNQNLALQQNLKLLKMSDQADKETISNLRRQILEIKTKMLHKNESKRTKALQDDRKMKKIQKLIDNLRLQIDEIRNNIANQQIAYQKQRQRMESIQKQETMFGKQHWVNVDRNNKYLDMHYKIQGNSLIKIGSYGSFQVLGRDPFPLTGKHYYYLFVDLVNWGIFSIGICHQKLRNYENTFRDPFCINYFGKTGGGFVNGMQRSNGPPIPNGVDVIVVVDQDKGMVKWYMNGEQIGSTLMPDKLIGQRLVPFVILNYPDNKITFNKRNPQEVQKEYPDRDQVFKKLEELAQQTI